jgi:PAS domain S-box-containing protein
MWEPERERLRVGARAGEAARALEATGDYYNLDEGYTGWIAHSRQPLLISDASQRSEVLPGLKTEESPFGSYVGVPLMARNRFVGTLTLMGLAGRFDHDDLGLLQIVADQAAIAVENARLYSQQAERVAELSGLQKISQAISTLQDPYQLYAQLCERVAELMDVEIAAVLLYDQEQEALVCQKPIHGVPDVIVGMYRVPLPPGGAARGFWEAEFWFSNSVQGDSLAKELGLDGLATAVGVRSTAMATMTVGDERIGVLQVANKRNGAGFTLDDIRLLQIYATQAAMVVENARLYAEEQSRVAELEGLQQIAQALSAVTSPDELYAQLNERIGKLMNVEMCGMLIHEPEEERLVTRTPFYGVPDDISQQVSVPISEGSRAYKLWQERDVLVSNDVVAAEWVDEIGLRDMARQAGMRSVLIAPLSSGGRRFGLLIVSNRRDATDFDEDATRILSIFASQAAALIENARLYQSTDRDLQSRIAELRSLSCVSDKLNSTLELGPILEVIADEAVRAQGATCGGVVMLSLDEDGEGGTAVQRFGCLPEHGRLSEIELVAARKGEALTIANFEGSPHPSPHEGVHSAVVVPIHFEGEVAGVIELHSDRVGRLGPSSVGFLQALGSQASIAIGNATRYAEQVERGELLRRRAQQLAKIYELGRMFRGDRPEEQGLEAVARAVQDAVGFGVVLISVLDAVSGELNHAAAVGLIGAFEDLRKNMPAWRRIEESLRDEWGTSGSYFVPHSQSRAFRDLLGLGRTTPYTDRLAPGQWHSDDLLLVPLHSSAGEVIGLMTVDNPRDGAVPDQSTVETLEIFGNQAAVIIENSRLVESMEQRADELSLSLQNLGKSYQELDNLSREMMRKDMELSHANELLDLRAERLLALHRVVEGVDTTQPPAHALQDIAKSVVQEMEVDQCILALHPSFLAADGNPPPGNGTPPGSDSQQRLVVAAAAGRLPPDLDLEGYLTGDDPISQVYLTNRAALFNKDGDATGPAICEKLNVQSALVLPLTIGGRLAGALYLGSARDTASFGEDDRDLFGLLASQVVVEYENARLYQTVQAEASKASQERDRLNQLHIVITVLQQTRDLQTALDVIARGICSIGWERVEVTLRDENMQVTHRVTAGFEEGDAQRTAGVEPPPQVWRERFHDPDFTALRVGWSYFLPRDHPWVTEHVWGGTSDGRSPDSNPMAWHAGDLLYVPMFGGERIVGLIRLEDPTDELRPTEETLRPLELFVQQATSTLENKRLYQETLELKGYTEAVVASIQQGIVVVDREGMVESVNDFVREAYGWGDEIVGQVLWQARPAAGEIGLDQAIRQAVSEGKPQELPGVVLTAPDGEARTLNVYVYPRFDDERQVNGAVALLEDMTQRARLEQDIALRGKQLAVLSDVSRIITSTLSVDDVVELVLDAIDRVVAYDSVALWLREGDSLRIVGARGYPDEEEMIGLRVDLEDSVLFGQIAEEKRELLVGDVRDDPRFPTTETRPTRSWLGLPLVSKDEIIGLITLDKTEAHFYAPADCQVAQAFANQAAVALENARLYEEATRRAAELDSRSRRLALLNRISSGLSRSLDVSSTLQATVDAICDALGVAQGGVMMFDRAHDEGRLVAQYPSNLDGSVPDIVIPLEGNLAIERVCDTKSPLAIEDAQDDPLTALMRDVMQARNVQSILIVPLVVGGEVTGTLELDSTTERRHFDSDQIALAQTVTNQAAVAVQNARLYQETVERAAELSTINEIGRAITQTIAAEDLYRTLREQIGRVIGKRSLTLALYDEANDLLTFPMAVRDGEPVALEPAHFGADLYSWVVSNRQPLLIGEDVIGRSIELGVEQADPALKSFLAVPLFSAERVVGVLAVEGRELTWAFSQADQRLLSTIAAQVAVAIENTRLYGELQQRLSETTTLQEVSRVVNSSLDLQEIFERMVSELAKNFHYPMIGLFGVEQGGLHLKASHGYSDEQVERFGLLSLEAGIIGRAARSCQPQFVGDVSRDPDHLPIVEGVACQISVPIVSDEEVLGVLNVQAGQDGRLDDNDLQLLCTFAGQVATAMANARLYDQMISLSEELERRVEERTRELQDERDRIDTLFHITSELTASLDLDRVLNGALELLGKAVNAEHGSLFLIDPQSDQLIWRAVMSDYEILPPGGRQIELTRHEGMAGWVMDNRQGVVVGDVRQDQRWKHVPGTEERRSLMGAPLVANEEVLGCIFMASDVTDAFNAADLALVEAAAHQVATAINNAELYRLIRDQAERLGSMLRSQQVEASKSQAILEGVADGVMVSDASGEIILFNAAAERVLGLRRDEVLGRPSTELTGLYGAGAQRWARALEQWTTDPMAYQDDYIAEQIEFGDRVVSVHVSPVLHEDEFLGLVSVFRDITREVEVDRMKSEFVATVSHELRTPMTSIKGYADLLLLGAAGQMSDDQRRFLEIIKNNADRLSLLVNDLLDISRIEQGRVELDIRPVDMREVILSVLEALQGRLQDEGKDLKLAVDLPDELPDVPGDFDRVTQIVTNLAHNAYQYTPEGGRVTLRAQADEAGVVVQVIDTGIGIAPEDQERVFERFYRGEDPLVMQSAGTGLGLSIVQHLVEMHHGELWFESELGKGTTFSFRLPYSHNSDDA